MFILGRRYEMKMKAAEDRMRALGKYTNRTFSIGGKLIQEKTRSKKSHDTVPLKQFLP